MSARHSVLVQRNHSSGLAELILPSAIVAAQGISAFVISKSYLLVFVITSRHTPAAVAHRANSLLFGVMFHHHVCSIARPAGAVNRCFCPTHRVVFETL